MQSNGDGQRSSECRGGESRNKRRQTLRDVVETDGQPRECTHSLEALLVGRHHLRHVPELLWTQRDKILQEWRDIPSQ